METKVGVAYTYQYVDFLVGKYGKTCNISERIQWLFLSRLNILVAVTVRIQNYNVLQLSFYTPKISLTIILFGVAGNLVVRALGQ